MKRILILILSLIFVANAHADFAARPLNDLTLKKFPQNFAHTTTHLFSKDNILPFVIGVGAIAGSTVWDTNVKNYFSKEFRFSEPANIATDAGNGYTLVPATLALFGIGLVSHNEKFHRMTYALTEGMLLNTIITTGVKFAADRTRPNGANDLSFPSGHASSAFMWATVLERYYGWKAGVPAYAAASFIGISRLEKNVHFLSDVVAGASFGYLVGRTVSRDAHKPTHVVMIPELVNKGAGLEIVIR